MQEKVVNGTFLNISFDEKSLVFYVNGKRIQDNKVDPRMTLATYLRDVLNLTGTKIGCNEGGCGACCVMLSDLDPLTDEIRHYSVNACLTPVCYVFGKAVTTVEGIGSVVKKRLHPIQERLSIAHGSQCGYCTPGFVMAMYALLRNKPNPTREDIDEAIQGNLCRCTGYRPILEAFYFFAENPQNGTLKASANGTACPMGEKCCKVNGNSCGSDRKEATKLSSFDKVQRYDETQELIFPAELKANDWHKKSFYMEKDGFLWFQPTDLRSLIQLKSTYPNSRFISGNTEIGVEMKFRFIEAPVIINVKQVPELRRSYSLDEEFGVYLGMALSLNEVKEIMKKYIKEMPKEKTQVFKEVHDMLYYFAGKHVRNMATIAGNIATASPISDLNPIWMASGAKILLNSISKGERTIPIDEHFFLGYRKPALSPDEVISGIWIPCTKPNQIFRAYKQAQRREDDISIVTGAFLVEFSEDKKVKDLKIAFGGMAPVTKLALESMKGVEGRKFDEKLLEEISNRLTEEFRLPPDVPGGMPQYRQALTLSFWLKFYNEVQKKMKTPNGETEEDLETGAHHGEDFHFTQIYAEVPESQKPTDPVGRPIMHASGQKHVTGEAIYSTDVKISGCLHMAYVTSPVASGKIVAIDTTKALQMPGVVGYVDANDVPGSLLIIHNDTPIFAKEKVEFHGQPIGAIIAEDHEAARRAAAQVKVTIEKETPVVTIEQALEKQTFLNPAPYYIHSSLLEQDAIKEYDWSKYEKVVEGSIRMGGQEHFYLETHNCVVIPGEDDEIEVISSTQGVSDVQRDVSLALGVPKHMIVVKVKRIGGGFGGKESAAGLFAAGAAVAAVKLRKPVQIYVERFDDMAITGTRHPFRFDYKVAIDNAGKFLNFDAKCYSNCGFSLDLSKGVMERAMVHIDNVYKFENVDIMGRLCKTNLASNTAFRGFGGPQGMFATETIIKHIAEKYGLDENQLREQNFYGEGDCTPFGMHLRQCNIRRCWDECVELSDFKNRKIAVEEFNKTSKYVKRGIYVVPTKFGIGFGFKQLNQAGALIHIYTDGSVLVSHAGMEMGQGLHTKILQIAARCLDIDISLVHIDNTSTDKVPNTSPTAASVGSDMNGLAVQDACRKLMERIKPFKEANPTGKWQDWVMAAYVNRVSLSATGFGIIHSEPVDFFNGKGAELFGYCVYGVGCAEVEVDCLTGDHKVLRTDIVMDVGDSLNPAVDIGQIEGAFVQGYGLFTMEELRVRPDGSRLTRGPGNYKIPSADDAPRNFHVKLLKGSSNRMGIFSSKAIGEPPLFLGSCVFFAIREAVRSYRMDQGHKGYFRMDSPATPERIRMACEDAITQQLPKLPDEGSYNPWVVNM